MSLTKHPPGSSRELWKISFPLMLSFFSGVMMMFVDRVYLAYYSLDAMNAAVSAGTIAYGFIWFWASLTGMAEVFVAQSNGAKRYKNLGEPVWQMLWVALLSILAFIPLGLWGAKDIFVGQGNADLQSTYFSWLMYVGPSMALLAALSAFFIGQGMTAVITWMAVLGNGVNIALDPIFIFGYGDIIPSMGVRGAALATGIGNSIQVAILLFLFLRKKNRESKGTTRWRLQPALLRKCLRVGLPPAIFVCLELVGWGLFYEMMAELSPTHILVAGVCQSIFILFLFFGLGLEKGAVAVAGNLIGAGKAELLPKVFVSGLKLSAAYLAVLLFFFVVYPDLLIEAFFLGQQTPEASGSADLENTRHLIHVGLAITCVYLVFDAVRMHVNGILLAAGDSFFLMIAGSFSVWILMLLPTYVFVLKRNGSVTLAFIITALYSIAAASISYTRFVRGAWKEKAVLLEG